MDIKKYELSTPQKSIWLTEQIYNGTNIGTISGTLFIDENINIDLLKETIKIFINKNDSMRTRIIVEDGNPKQFINAVDNPEIEVLNLNNELELKKLENEVSSHVFNLINSELYIFKIFKLQNGNGGIVSNLHHLIADAWSFGIMSKQLKDIYEKLLLNEDFSENNPSYTDYIENEKNYYASEKYIKDKDYWQNRFLNVPELSCIKPYNNENASTNANRYKASLDINLCEKINKYAKENNTSAYSFLMSIFSIYLSRVSSLDSVVIGTPFLNRSNFKEKNTMGMFVNTLPNRLDINWNLKFSEYLKYVTEEQRNMFRHSKYPYNELLEKVRKDQSITRNLYDIAMSYQNARNDSQISNINYHTYWNFCGKITESMEIHVFDMDNTGSLQLLYDYQTVKFSEEEIKDIHSRILHIINQVLDNEKLLKDIEIVTPEEKQKLLYEFNNTKSEYPRDKTIAQVFEKQVELYPEKLAIVFETESLTYKEFNEKSNKLAKYLSANGVNAKDNVVILAEKSIDLYVSIMAILKLGALYVPVDNEYPEDRIKLILDDCKPKVVIVDEKSADLVKNKKICTIPLQGLEDFDGSNLENKITAEDGAYIIYTSGSTGKPKGVMVPHRGVVRLVKNTNYIEFKETDRILQNIPVVFDASTFAIFGSFLNGLTLYPIQKHKLLDFEYLEKFIKENKINIINSTVSFFNKLIEYNPKIFDECRSVLIGGEEVLPKTVNIFRENNPQSEIVNVYGPTENSNLSSCHIIRKEYKKSVPIGIPVSNSTCYILDKHQNLLPIGIPGEIYVGGDGVALGYLNNPELTNEKFIPNIFGEGKLYKTGDLGYWENEGVIQFMSRIDNQVKIRGFRIELKEIETKILEFGHMKECAVIIADNNKTKMLVGCIGTSEQIDVKELNAYLKAKLPSYMVPSKYIVVDSLPLNINGKLDAKKLLKELENQKDEIIPARNETEQILVDIWKDILGLENVGINQNFFEIGGDSLLAIKLLSFINLKFNIQITINALFDMPTIEELATHIENRDIEKIFNQEKKNNSDLNTNFSEIDKLLSKNTIDNFSKPQHQNIGNVLLFGATGFLGAHVLSNYLDNEKGTLYCVVRRKKGLNPKDRLIERLNFYFGDKYNDIFNKRVKVFEGDIVLENLGLNTDNYNKLGGQVDTVINAAAIVKHYGKKKLFEDINIKGTENIIDFCEKFNKKFLHCSTLSLTRDLTRDVTSISNSKIFSEKDFYFDQNLNNLYIKSKFKSEELVYKARIRGLNACCLRIGNISNRFSDGMFQENIEENAILAKLKSFIYIGYIPDYLLDLSLDFTQVDICSNAILKIANTDVQYSTFHIFNNNTITMRNLIDILNKLSIKIVPIAENEFTNIFENIRQDEDKRDITIGIIQDWIRDRGFNYYYNISFNSDFTNKYLESLDFTWPKPDQEYFKKFINYLRKIGYIGGKTC